MKKEINLKFSDMEKKFWASELKNNQKFFLLMYTLIGSIEILMLLAMLISNKFSVIPNINTNYTLFYIVGICISISSMVLIKSMKTNNKILQVTIIFITMLWACLFAINDHKNGLNSYVLAQVLILTAASIRLPGRVHFSINFITFLLYALLLYPLESDHTIYLSNIINTGILFLFSSFIALFINESRYQNFKNTLTMEQQQQQLLHMTQYDGLTELYSRTMILNYLEDAIEHGEKIGCIMADIDNFKKYNDEYGHRTGDEVLRKTAFLLNNIIKTYGGEAGRYGGEEFLIVLLNCDAGLLQNVLEDLQTNFHEPRDHYSITLSMGGTLYKQDEKADTLITRADQAMYRAKNAGKHTYRIL